MTTVAEALGQLDSINNLADLRALALELSAAADKPNAILYSGPLADTQAYKVASQIADQLDLAIIDNTARGQFMLSDEFDAALDRIIRSEFPAADDTAVADIAREFLSSDSDSLWRVTAREFAGSVEGSVLPLAPNATENGIFYQEEITAYLNNGYGGEGQKFGTLDKATLTEELATQGIDQVFEDIKADTSANLFENGLFKQADGTYTVAEDAFARYGYLEGTAESAADLRTAGAIEVVPSATDPVTLDALERVSPDYAHMRVDSEWKFIGLDDISRGLKVVGAAGIAYDTLTSAAEAAEQVANGQNADAIHTLTDLAARLYFGLEGAEAGALIFGGLAAETGPGAIVAGLVGGVIGGIAGALGGQVAIDAIWATAEKIIQLVAPEVQHIEITPSPEVLQLKNDLLTSGVSEADAQKFMDLVVDTWATRVQSEPTLTLTEVAEQLVADVADNQALVPDSNAGVQLAVQTTSGGQQNIAVFDDQNNVLAQAVGNGDGSLVGTVVDAQGETRDGFVFRADGTPEQVFFTNSDGSRTEASFDLQGRLDVAQTTYSDGSKLIADYDQDATKTWTEQDTSLDALGQTTQIVTTNDDGSKESDIFDVANGQSWSEQSTFLDAQSRTDKVVTTNDDGTKLVADYDQDATKTWSEQDTSLDALGQTTQVVTLNDDASRETAVFDVANTQTWTEQDTFLDALGRTDKIVTTNDDATKLIADLDQAGTQLWSEQDTSLNAAGLTTQIVTLNDDASRETAVFDVANVQAWTEQDTFLDAQGRTDKIVTTNDDGTKLIADLDQANTQLWSEQDTTLNAAGQTMQVVTLNDDGSRETDVFDVTNAQTWSVQETFLDPQGRTDKVDTVSDSGVQTIVDYDQDGSKPWTQETITIDALGRTDQIVAANDDGSTSTTTFDVGNTQTWAQETTTLDGLGRTLTTDVTEDSGTREVTAFDPANTQAWSEHLTEYDSTGRAVGDVYSYDTADTWTASHDLSSANLATFDEAAATDLAAEVERLAFEGTNANDGMPTMFSYEPMFGSGYDFGMGNFDINSGDFTNVDLVDSGSGFDFTDAGWTDFTVASGVPETGIFDDWSFDDFFAPIILDLNHDGISIMPRLDSTAYFNVDADPAKEQTAWMGPGDGMLVIDLAEDGTAGANGLIDRMDEIAFANWTADPTDSDAQALATVFDTNHNGQLDPGDARWNDFRVWVDANENGTSDAGELKTLSSLGITSLSLTTDQQSFLLADGSRIDGLGSYSQTINGSTTTGTFADAALAYQSVGFIRQDHYSDANGGILYGFSYISEDGTQQNFTDSKLVYGDVAVTWNFWDDNTIPASRISRRTARVRRSAAPPETGEPTIRFTDRPSTDNGFYL